MLISPVNEIISAKTNLVKYVLIVSGCMPDSCGEKRNVKTF